MSPFATKTKAIETFAFTLPDSEWRAKLTPEQYKVMRGHGTERACTSPLNAEKRQGVYCCAGCGQALFDTGAKFESGTGWPSFFQPIGSEAVSTSEDRAYGMLRVEVHCHNCGSHLGHVFPDGPAADGPALLHERCCADLRAGLRAERGGVSVEIKVGPPQLAIHQGYTLLLTDLDGQIVWSTDKGLYFFDTRVISAYALYANGEGWDLLNSGAPSHYGAKIFLTNRKFPSEGGDVPARTLSLVVTRVIDGGMHESFELTNHGRTPVHFNLELALRSDFSDIFEVKANRIVRRGRISTTWSDETGELTTSYRNGGFHRAVCTRVDAPTPAMYANGRLNFTLLLQPGEAWRGSLLYDLVDGEQRYSAPRQCQVGPHTPQARQLQQWRDRCMKLETSVPGFRQLFEQAVEDLAALRLPVESGSSTEYVPAAGLPWFVALFGRDPLIVSLQTMILSRISPAARSKCLGRGNPGGMTIFVTPSLARSCMSCAAVNLRR